MEPILEVKGVSKIYGRGCGRCFELTGPHRGTNLCSACGSVVACAHVSFELYEREALGIVGESGSGKSTLIKLLNLELEPTEGEMFINLKDFPELRGKNVFSLDSYQKRRLRNFLFGTVYQNPYLGLNMDMSAISNVAEKLIMANYRNVKEIQRRAQELLKRMDFPVERIKEPPKNFSGGMQQRIQIAKALANGPKILLLDEVTTGLDVSVQASVLDLIRSIHRELGISMIVVSHDLKVINLLTDRTVVMRYGRVVEKGLTDQILQDPQHGYTQLLVLSQL
ncbi:ATP-binding cassette domain-containing protein [Thermocrinis sp.]